MAPHQFPTIHTTQHSSSGGPLRLASWYSETGGPAFLSTVPGGVLETFADQVESDQLAWVSELLAQLKRVDPTDHSVPRTELVAHLAHAAIAAETALRVAESRGQRLTQEWS
jgi:hypothetical protein